MEMIHDDEIQEEVDAVIAEVKEMVRDEDLYGLLGKMTTEIMLVNAGIFAILEYLGEHHED